MAVPAVVAELAVMVQKVNEAVPMASLKTAPPSAFVEFPPGLVAALLLKVDSITVNVPLL